jgi:hypothetical protein
VEFVAGGPPTSTEIEVSVLVAGKGETIVLHLGDNHWGIIDCCRLPTTNDAVPLAYLSQLGVDPSAVEFIFATHWHDDHIDGLAEVLGTCGNAEFGCSQAHTAPAFEALVLEYPKVLKSAPIQEMRRCFELIEARPPVGPVRHTPTRIVDRSIVWERDDKVVAVRALAPTPQAIARAEQDIATKLLPAAKKRLSLGKNTPNRASIVVNVEIPNDAVLCGGDLEESGSRGSGWSAVIARIGASHQKGLRLQGAAPWFG